MNIAVIGVGYVGLVTGVVFSDLGNDVACVDIDEDRITGLNQGKMPIYEPGLEEMVARNFADGRLKFTTDIKTAIEQAQIIFVAVGTPPKDNGETDLSYVDAVARSIGEYINDYKVIVNKSTVPVMTGDRVREIIERHKRRDVDFDVVSNPEFLREGSAIPDALEPDRIVIGAPNKHVAMMLLELYATLERPMLITDVRSAEVIKYASNAFLATKISFINMIANLCERVGADVNQVAKGMGFDRRIGPQFLNAGLGFGGSCFPKDVESLIHTTETHGVDTQLLKSVMAINKGRAAHFADFVSQKLGGVDGKTIAILGLAFKPNTDDMREAKSIEIIERFVQLGAKVRAYDPVSMENARKFMPSIEYVESSYDAVADADAMVLVTEWREFKQLNMDKVKSLMREPVIFDGRNMYDPQRERLLGFTYYSIGRGNAVT
ncbi:MAG: UDP-glucose/GDP-mannose dehydrogenase family protein [Myxococcales bacterium]|nr:UDP-glucose/GDP-mannose dehydrogenase family protein [Myxococcales bacterium]